MVNFRLLFQDSKDNNLKENYLKIQQHDKKITATVINCSSIRK